MSYMIPITGNTYPVKESLKALGARWNPDAKAWMVAAEKADEARRIVAGAPAKPRNYGTGSYRTIGKRMQQRQHSTGWTGCSCGSIEGRPRASDCASCQHDY